METCQRRYVNEVMGLAAFILGWTVLVLITNTIAMLIKEPTQETDNENQPIKPRLSSRVDTKQPVLLLPVSVLEQAWAGRVVWRS